MYAKVSRSMKQEVEAKYARGEYLGPLLGDTENLAFTRARMLHPKMLRPYLHCVADAGDSGPSRETGVLPCRIAWVGSMAHQ